MDKRSVIKIGALVGLLVTLLIILLKPDEVYQISPKDTSYKKNSSKVVKQNADSEVINVFTETKEGLAELRNLNNEYANWILENKDKFSITEGLLLNLEYLPYGRYVGNDIWMRLRIFVDGEVKDIIAKEDEVILNHNSISSSDNMFKYIITSSLSVRRFQLGYEVPTLDSMLIESNSYNFPRHMHSSLLEVFRLSDIVIEIVTLNEPLYTPQQFREITLESVVGGNITYNIILDNE